MREGKEGTDSRIAKKEGRVEKGKRERGKGETIGC